MKPRIATWITLAFIRITLGVLSTSMVAAYSFADVVPEGAALQQTLIGIWGASRDGGKTFVGFEKYQQEARFYRKERFPIGQDFAFRVNL